MAIEDDIEVDDNIGNRKSDIRNENHNQEGPRGLRKRKRLPKLPDGFYIGKTARWVKSSGYGFLICREFPTENIFVHYEDIVGAEGKFKTLKDRRLYSFKLEKTDKGYRGRKVTLL